MNSETSPDLPDPPRSPDPFQPPTMDATLESLGSNAGLGWGFWSFTNFSFVLSVLPFLGLLLTNHAPFATLSFWGLMNLIATTMTVARAMLWKRRLEARDKVFRHENGVTMFVISMLIGYVADVISIICCGIICVPLSIAAMSSSSIANGTSAAVFMVALSSICIAFGMWVGYLFVRLTVPLDPAE